MKIYAAKICEIREAEAESLYELLGRDRQKKVLELKNQRERERSIFAGLLLRYSFLKAGYDAEMWAQAEIGKGLYGKPFIKGYHDFQYSLSHSGEWIVCAADTMPLGVDIQEMKEWKLQMAKRFYHEKEYNRILKLEETDTANRRTKEFYSIWTAKESVVKLSGRGIGAGISRYVTSDNYSCVYDMDNKQTINIRLYDELEGYIACICNREGNFPEKLEEIDFNNLAKWRETDAESQRKKFCKKR